MKKRRILIVLASLILLLALGVGAYWTGLWMPNYPNEIKYPVRGIDVSRHQKDIEWPAVARGNVHFVYIKATEGGDFQDVSFTENWKGSGAAGLRRGAYHFYTLKTPGAQQAANFIATVPNDPDALPPVVDVEQWGDAATRPSVADFQRELGIFISTLRKHYHREPVIYTAMDYKKYYLQNFPAPRLWFRAVVFTPRFFVGDDWTFWQYSEKGRVSGIEGFVDQNVFNGDQTKFEAFSQRRE